MNNSSRTASNLNPGDIIFGDEMIWGITPGNDTPMGRNLLIMTDKDTFQIWEGETL